MNVMKFAVVTVVAGGLLAGCQTLGGQKQTVGALGGAALGGLAGSQIGGGDGRLLATGVGAVLGALIGSEIGRSLDDADRLAAERASQRAFETTPTGQATSWRNPDSGNYGEITPVRTYQSDGRDCRDFTHTIYVDGRSETARGTACRQSDGTWRVVS